MKRNHPRLAGYFLLRQYGTTTPGSFWYSLVKSLFLAQFVVFFWQIADFLAQVCGRREVFKYWTRKTQNQSVFLELRKRGNVAVGLDSDLLAV